MTKSSSQTPPPSPTDEDFLVAVDEALEKNLLPAPGFEALERTRNDVLAALVPLVARLRAAAVPVPPPADQTAIRAAVIDALYEARRAGLGGMSEAAAVAHMADAVLAVLPEQTDRAAVLLEGANAIEATFTGPGLDRYTRYGADLLRRVAAEEQPAAGCWCGHPQDRHWAGSTRMTFPDGCHDCRGWTGAHVYGQELPWADDKPDAERPAVGEQPETQEAPNSRTVCTCGHVRGEHVTVSGRLLCDACDPDSTDNLVCKEFEAL